MNVRSVAILANALAISGSTLFLAACGKEDGTGPNNNVTIASIAVSASPTTLERTLTTQAVAVARDEDDAIISNPSLSWSSSNTNVASVSNSGLITTAGRGTTRITAASGSISGFVDVDIFVNYGGMSVGDTWACDVGSIGLVHCWGSNNRGQFGTGNATNSTVPVTATGTVRLTKLAAGESTVCGLTAAGAAYCTGANASGQLGIGAAGDRNVFTAVTGGLIFTTISVGEDHACALNAAGAAYCWGENFDGQLGTGNTTSSNAPVLVLGGIAFAKIDAGSQSTCAVTADNRGFCWGQDASGQIGDGGVISNNTVDKKLQPTQVVGGAIFSSISAGGNTACAVTTTSEVRCWGDGGTGMHGNGVNASNSQPAAAASGGLTFRSVDVSKSNYVCGVTTNNQAHCWGRNVEGQLGSANPVDLSTTPIRAAGTLTFSEVTVSMNGNFTCGVSVDHRTTYCWGSNASGQMGNGTSSAARNPTATVVSGQSPS